MAEKKVIVQQRYTRRPKQVYGRTHQRNEGRDMFCLCLAALFMLKTEIPNSPFKDLRAMAERVRTGAAGVPAPAERRVAIAGCQSVWKSVSLSGRTRCAATPVYD